jgi:DNA-binding response OmpR family regulator
VTITGRPRSVKWRGLPVGLSPTQAEIFATIANRGRASFEAIDEAMLAFGASPLTRSVHILRIRRKFEAIGARDPFERVGNSGFRFVSEPDEDSSTALIIGMRARA